MKKKIIFAAAIIMVFLAGPVFTSAQPARDVYVSIILPSEINASQNYSKFMMLRNGNYTSGITDSLSSKVYVNISGEAYFSNWSVLKTINSYSESGFGAMSLGGGEYTLCIFAEPQNYIDPDLSNNFLCGSISAVPEPGNSSLENITNTLNATINGSEVNSSFNVSDNFSYNLSGNISNNVSCNLSDDISINSSINFSGNLSGNYSDNSSNDSFNNSSTDSSDDSSAYFSFCNCTLSIETDKLLYSAGEKISFRINDCSTVSSFPHPVEYWVEDRDGTAKHRLNTTSKALKSYTPSVSVDEKYFLVKARFAECGSRQNASEKLVVFLSDLQDSLDAEETAQETTLSLEVLSESSGTVIYASVKGHKGDTDKTLISLWVEAAGKKYSETTKAYISKKNSDFSLKVPLLVNISSSGNYTVVAEGLGERDEKSIAVARAAQDKEAGAGKKTAAKNSGSASNASDASRKNTNDSANSSGGQRKDSAAGNYSAQGNQLTAGVAASGGYTAGGKKKGFFTAGNAAFALAAAGAGFLLFNRKARMFLLKKTKLFK